MPDAEGAVERLYEDTDVRDELRDDEANLLLKWAEARLYKLADESATDEAFDAKAAQFRGLLKGMNRLVGKRAALDEATLNARLAELSTQAESVSAPGGVVSAQAAAPSIPADQLKAVAGKLPSLDDAGAVNALTALFTPNALTPGALPATASGESAVNALTPGPVPLGSGEKEISQDVSASSQTSEPPPAQAAGLNTPVTPPSVADPVPVPKAEPAAVSPPDALAPTAEADEDDGGFLHRLSIHFWPPRKKNSPQ